MSFKFSYHFVFGNRKDKSYEWVKQIMFPDQTPSATW